MAELERLLAVEQELTQQQTTLSTLKQTMKEVLDAVQSLASPAASQNTSGTPSAQPLPVVKSSSSTRLKPATPTEFDGSRCCRVTCSARGIYELTCSSDNLLLMSPGPANRVLAHNATGKHILAFRSIFNVLSPSCTLTNYYIVQVS